MNPIDVRSPAEAVREAYVFRGAADAGGGVRMAGRVPGLKNRSRIVALLRRTCENLRDAKNEAEQNSERRKGTWGRHDSHIQSMTSNRKETD